LRVRSKETLNGRDFAYEEYRHRNQGMNVAGESISLDPLIRSETAETDLGKPVEQEAVTVPRRCCELVLEATA
jgi:hypothetical protein